VLVPRFFIPIVTNIMPDFTNAVGLIKGASLKVSDTDLRHRYADATGFILEGIIKGGTPSNIRWRRNDKIILNDDSFRISPRKRLRNKGSCLDQIYVTQLQVKGKLIGTYYFTTNNQYTHGISSNIIIIKGIFIAS